MFRWQRIATALWLALAAVVVAIMVARWRDSREGRPNQPGTTVQAVPVLPTPVVGGGADPREALAGALKLRDPGERARAFGRELSDFAARDAEAALDYVRHLPPGSPRTQGLLLVLDVLSRQDEERALRLAAELLASRDEMNFYSGLFDRIARRDIAAARSRLSVVPAGVAREKALRALADVWTLSDAAAAFGWAAGLAGADRAPALESVLTSLADTDPLKTIDYAQQALTGVELERTVSRALQRLTAKDPKAAAGLVKLLPPGELQSFATLDVARAFASLDPVAAIGWVKTIPVGELQNLALIQALISWASDDLSAATHYVAQMPAGPAQNSASSQIVLMLVKRSPADAVAWASALASATARESALLSVASAWAQQDAAAAARWAATLPESSLQQSAIAAALTFWILRDPAAARDHVRQLSGPTQTVAAQTIAPLLAQSEPAVTMDWALSLTESTAREAATRAAYRRWLDNNPVAANTWLAAANLEPTLRALLGSSSGP